VFSVESKSKVDGTLKTTHYMKGATKVDNLSWLNNLGSELLISRSLPVHEFDNRSMSSLAAKHDLMLAKKLAASRQSSDDKKSKKKQKDEKAKGGSLISYDADSDDILVYSQIYYGRKMWKLSMEHLPLSQLRPQYMTQFGISY
jgi:hypothetical protein